MAFFKQTFDNLSATRNRTHQGDAVLLLIAGTLILIGLVVLFSASSAVSFIKFGNSYAIFRHQMEGFILGLFAFAFFSKINYQIWQKSAVMLLFISIFMLLLVFIPGLRADWGTSRSWISVFGFSVQPSEFVKLSFLLYLSAWLVKRKDKLSGMSEGFGPFMFILGIIVFLMLLQPDFGTLSIIAATSMIIYYIGGGKLKHILAVGLIALVGIFGMVQVKEY